MVTAIDIHSRKSTKDMLCLAYFIRAAFVFLSTQLRLPLGRHNGLGWLHALAHGLSMSKIGNAPRARKTRLDQKCLMLIFISFAPTVVSFLSYTRNVTVA